ncbi:MAG: hypothetical protein PWQ61_2289, partial [Betaproteobacteria bacterium]|nr:hypothetical protein [Betaproteobacteria bacterium]
MCSQPFKASVLLARALSPEVVLDRVFLKRPASLAVSVRQSHLEPERDTKDARVRVTSLRTHEHFGNR